MTTTMRLHEDVTKKLAASRVLPVVTVTAADQAARIGSALMSGGLGCMEITFRTSAAAGAVQRARELDGLIVGAGTILSTEHAREASQAGAHFAVAPGFNLEVVVTCLSLGLPFFPGVATPSEIERARRFGFRTLKVFPASTLGGPSFLRAVSATYPDMRFIPTGGIGLDTLKEYLSLPSVLAVGGSWLATQNLIEAERYDEIERLAAEATACRP
jgi:2-dehydro-3-deoxyphosphogluconate aldolase/(4S)-4-hydroxy-2-oxoglutarate aldolase